MRKGLQLLQSFRRQDLSTTPYPSNRRHLVKPRSPAAPVAPLHAFFTWVYTGAGKPYDVTRALQNTGYLFKHLLHSLEQTLTSKYASSFCIANKFLAYKFSKFPGKCSLIALVMSFTSL